MTQESLLAPLQNHVTFKEQRKQGTWNSFIPNSRNWPFTNSRDRTKGSLQTSELQFPLFLHSSLCCPKGLTQLPSYLLALLVCAPAPCRQGACGRGCRWKEWSWAEPREGRWAPAAPAAWWTLPPGMLAGAWGQGTRGSSVSQSWQDSQQPQPS